MLCLGDYVELINCNNIHIKSHEKEIEVIEGRNFKVKK